MDPVKELGAGKGRAMDQRVGDAKKEVEGPMAVDGQEQVRLVVGWDQGGGMAKRTWRGPWCIRRGWRRRWRWVLQAGER